MPGPGNTQDDIKSILSKRQMLRIRRAKLVYSTTRHAFSEDTYDGKVSAKLRHLPDNIVEVIEGAAAGLIPQLLPKAVGGKHMVGLMRRFKV